MWRYIQIGEHSFIPAYNLFVGLGIALAMLYLQYEKKFANFSFQKKNAIHTGLFISIIFGFVGAFTFDAYTQGIKLSLSNLNQIGLTLLGGIVAGLLTFSIFLKIKSIPVLSTLNILRPAFYISHLLGRVGCFFTGCCYGSPTNSIFGVQFPKDSLAHTHFQADLHVHPTQLYESIFILFVFLFVRRSSINNKFLFYIISYSIFRFFIEFIRADNRGIIFNQSFLTPSQFISLTIAVFAIVLTYIINRKSIHQPINS